MSQDPRELDRAPVPPRGRGDRLTCPLPPSSESIREDLVHIFITGLAAHFAAIDEALEFARENG